VDLDESCDMELDAEPKASCEPVVMPADDTEMTAEPSAKDEVPDAKDKRTEFSVIMEELGNMNADLVNSGTAIRLKDKQLYISVIGKLGGGRVRELVTISKEFRRLGRASLETFLPRIINTAIFTPQDWTLIKAKFTGTYDTSRVISTNIFKRTFSYNSVFSVQAHYYYNSHCRASIEVH
jgi:hypothetical protein